MRLGSKEYRQFVGIARGSAGEVCYQLLLARDLNYISGETCNELRTGYDRVIQMLTRLSESLQKDPRSRRAYVHESRTRLFSCGYDRVIQMLSRLSQPLSEPRTRSR